MLGTVDMQPTIDEIIEMINSHVLPFFDDMDSREKVLKNRLKYHEIYELFEWANTIDLEEAMIYGRAGDIEKATQIIQQRYDNSSSHKLHQDYLVDISIKVGITLNVKAT